MARLTTKARNKLPGSTFAGPNRSFPIPDREHARAALQDLPKTNKLSPSQKSHVRAVAERKLRGGLLGR